MRAPAHGFANNSRDQKRALKECEARYGSHEIGIASTCERVNEFPLWIPVPLAPLALHIRWQGVLRGRLRLAQLAHLTLDGLDAGFEQTDCAGPALRRMTGNLGQPILGSE